MSLVNDMLNDLEQRRDKAPVVDLSWMKAAATPIRSRSKYPLVVLSALIMLALLSAVAWQYWQKTALAAAASKLPAQPQVISPALVITPRLLSVSWSQEKNATHLQWHLSELKPYRIHRTDSGLELQFFDVANQLVAAELKPLPPVQAVTVQQQGQDTIVSLGIDGAFSFSDQLSKDNVGMVELIIQPIAKPAATTEKKLAAPAPVADRRKGAVATKNTKTNTQPAVAASQLTLSQQDMQLARRAKKLLQSGDSYQAQQLLQDFVEQNPQASRSGKLLATIWISQRQLAQAESLIEQMLAGAPTDVDWRVLKARLLMAENDYQAAVVWLMQAVPPVRQHQDYYELLGFAARQNQQYSLSEQAYKGLLDSDAERGDWWVGMAIALDAQGKLPAARAAYRQALAVTTISLPLKQYAQQRLTTLN